MSKARPNKQRSPKVKRPQDYRPASTPDGPSLYGPTSVTYDGETYAVDFDAVNDIEVLEAFQRPSGFFSGELNGAMTALQKSLGTAGYERFKADQVRKHGRCTATALFEAFDMVNEGAAGNLEASSNSSSDEAKL